MTEPSLTSRRAFLAATGTAALAGCLTETAPEGRTTTSNTTKSEPVTTRRETETATPDSSSTSWSQFGADARNTGYASSATGPKSEAKLAWRFDAGTPTMNASPVVVDGTVYAPGSGDPGYIHALDAEAGEEVWRFEPAGYATSAPAVADGVLYVGTWGKKFYALDAETGDELWSVEVGHRFGSSSPVVHGGTVYVGTTGDGPMVVGGPEDEEEFEACALLALDAETGDERWRYDDFGEKDRIDSSPAVADGRVYFGGESAVRALDAGSGAVAWTREISTHPQSSPTVGDGVVYYGAPFDGGSEDAPAAKLWALDAETGETVWTAGVEDTSLRTSPAVADGTVYAAASSTRVCAGVGGDGESNCSGETRGRLYAIDAATGDRRWKAEIRTDTRSSPAVADGVVYVGCDDGLSAVTTDGARAWRIDFEGERDDGPYVKSSPAVADGRVFVGASDGRLRALGE